MTSPISSPQNIFAIEQMSREGGAPSWLAWFAVSLPVAVVAALVIWGALLLAYPPSVKAVHQLPELKVQFVALGEFDSSFGQSGQTRLTFLVQAWLYLHVPYLPLDLKALPRLQFLFSACWQVKQVAPSICQEHADCNLDLPLHPENLRGDQAYT